MSSWIEKNDGTHVVFETNCYFGRSHANTIRLESPGASRRHAYIHAQQSENTIEYWLADLGSTNGNPRNGKRITLPGRLKDGDVITILGEAFVFRMETKSALPYYYTEARATVPVRANPQCWLLMVDIKRYTNLSRQLDTDTLSLKVGAWLRQCRDAIGMADGIVDRFLGDTILAYWKHSPDAPAQVSVTRRQLPQLQHLRDPDFRSVVDFAKPTLEGVPAGPTIFAVRRSSTSFASRRSAPPCKPIRS